MPASGDVVAINVGQSISSGEDDLPNGEWTFPCRTELPRMPPSRLYDEISRSRLNVLMLVSGHSPLEAGIANHCLFAHIVDEMLLGCKALAVGVVSETQQPGGPHHGLDKKQRLRPVGKNEWGFSGRGALGCPVS